MVVEDDTDILATLEVILEDEGYEVLAATNGLEALDAIKARGELPSLILLDMRMPVMDGWRFATALRKRYRSVSPLIVMSAAPDTEQRAEEIRATGWLSKPFDVNELLKKIREHAG